MSKLLLSGNEAIALACKHANVTLATGYPGTPSTEIIETIKKKSLKVQTQWSINEKVALEVAIGSCAFGQRSIVTMKHVGLNVAADPLMTFSYTGVNAGCVIITCDDPGMYSSQNEQDNRNYAKFAKIPMLEPSDSQEAFDFLLEAFQISETFDSPVLLRLSTRICHGKSIVSFKDDEIEREQNSSKSYTKQEKYLMLPSISRKRHLFVEQRLQKLEESSLKSSLNVFEKNNKQDDLLIITSGISYQYIKESFPGYSIFKIGFSYPQPNQVIVDIAKDYQKIVCIEELDPFIEENLLSSTCFLKNNIELVKRKKEFYCGELSPNRVKKIVANLSNEDNSLRSSKVENIYDIVSAKEVKPNPPKLCSGCPHLAIANLLRKMKVRVSGDIGCYTLAALEPFNSIDMVIDMGASIPMMTGALIANEQQGDQIQNSELPIVSIIGDSTFLHSGMTGLLNAKKHHKRGVICLLDNSTTAMTGRQDHPGINTSTNNISKELDSSNQIDYVSLVKALGIESVYLVDPYDIEHCEMVFKKALLEDTLTFIVFSRGCALLTKSKQEQVKVNNNCVKCGECLTVGCPSIHFDENLKRPQIDVNTCIGCNICLNSCNYDALKKETNDTISFLKIKER